MDPNSDDGPWLHGYAIGGVGGIPANQPVRVGPLGRVNFLVGRNNHGKSTLLRAAREWTRGRRSENGSDIGRRTLVPVSRGELLGSIRQLGLNRSQRETLLTEKLPAIDDDRVGVWLPAELVRIAHPATWNEQLLHHLAEQLEIPARGLTQAPSASAFHPDKAVLIPAFRELRAAVTGSDVEPSLASGQGLVAELARWQHPKNPGTPEYDRAKRRWMRLRDFVREVLEDPNAELEVADGTDLHVQLAQSDSMLHIDHLGDGIKQVLMIAATCLNYDDHLVLLEEPEIHLHAGLQRKLVRFLANETNNQYLIATHSAHVLDLPGARIFHVVHDGTSIRVTSSARASQVRAVCQDLGYIASDLLQANYTIWVEGPSDRLYWRAFLNLVDPDLEEGVHYAAMTYGGYLVDGLHLRDEAVVAEDLISVLQLGRTCTLIADSDKTSAEAPLRETLVRLAAEAAATDTGDLLVCDWVRTVENLLPRELVRAIVIEQHPRAGPRLAPASGHGPFDAPFEGMGDSTYSKVKIASALTERFTLADMDARLTTVVEELAAKIRRANGLPPRA